MRLDGAMRSASAARASAWLVGDFFPFWAERARHPRGGFRERVGLDGRPLDDDVSRVRVQARQTYVFARAALSGWSPPDSLALVETGVESLLRRCRRDDALFGRLVAPGLGLTDDWPELYDNAFALLALAWAARALDAPELVREADATLARIDAALASPAGGYVESRPPAQGRRQDPHMHLFEAALALYEASRAERHLVFAQRLWEFWSRHFFDPSTGCVRETLGAGLEPLPHAEAAVPGHAFEWVALLAWLARLSGCGEPAPTNALYAAALRSVDARSRTPMTASTTGVPVDASRRTWAQTETLRAHVDRARHGDPDAVSRVFLTLDAIFEAHLDPAPAGAWIDHYDHHGRSCVDSITAATGYHVVTAFEDVAAMQCMATT